MAKIFKISGYLIDANGDCTADDIEVYLDSFDYAFTQHIKAEERDIGEWYDDHPLNYYFISKEECEKYFKSDITEDIKHGTWKLHRDGSGTCDQCGGTARNVWDYDSWQNYCGRCGARMDGDPIILGNKR